MSETPKTPDTPETQTPKKRALLSVSDRTGLVEFGTALVGLGYELLSTGGTAHVLSDAGLPVNLISEITGFPEVFDGRVKTLHPKIFGGILYDRAVETHRKEADANAITPVDLVAVNLYPFKESLETGTASFEDLIEKIDVGGPSMLRAAAKNHAHVTVLCDPADYAGVLAELAGGGVSAATRRRLAAKVFRRTAAYDAIIASYLTSQAGEREPERLSLTFLRDRTLRYGENPHQQGAFYVDPLAPQGSLARFTSHQGKELSFNNLLDADAAVFASRSIGPNGLTIVKHRIASGIATGTTFAEALEKAWASDPVAAFGGVIAYLGTLDAEGAAALGTRFVEVLVVSH
ncbi:MAG: bifunctional phosphoribosylaminoimidazolecarboxamide formyltransferase/IMP cyclohydrolase, partial [Acidobacteria bacterium]|nr:bifunctional phosphoribosylaminoimidazolecarboxamide formyltransferase/IMP cyclohydrolase [Acidobacteriota bacterium]